jgi:hypothetical protein
MRHSLGYVIAIAAVATAAVAARPMRSGPEEDHFAISRFLQIYYNF